MPQSDPVVTVSLSREEAEAVLSRIEGDAERPPCSTGCVLCPAAAKVRAALDSQEGKEQVESGTEEDSRRAGADDLLQQARDFCAGSAAEYGAGDPHHTAYTNCRIFVERLIKSGQPVGGERPELEDNRRLGELTDAAMEESVVSAALDSFSPGIYTVATANRMRETLNVAIATAWKIAFADPHPQLEQGEPPMVDVFRCPCGEEYEEEAPSGSCPFCGRNPNDVLSIGRQRSKLHGPACTEDECRCFTQQPAEPPSGAPHAPDQGEAADERP